jgi:hypothetical protein
MNRAATNSFCLEEIIDTMLKGKCEIGQMETLVGVALQWVQDDKDARPTMSQVVEMLLGKEKDSVMVLRMSSVVSWPSNYDGAT